MAFHVLGNQECFQTKRTYQYMYLTNANLPPTRDNEKANEECILSERDVREHDTRKPTRGQYYLFNQQFQLLPREDFCQKGGCLALVLGGRSIRPGVLVRAWCPAGCPGGESSRVYRSVGVRSEHPPGCTGPSGVLAGCLAGCPGGVSGR